MSETKTKRPYVRKGSLKPEVPTPTPEETNPFASIAPQSIGVQKEEVKSRAIQVLDEKEQRRHSEMDYMIGIIDALALKHAHKHDLDMQEVKDDIVIRIIRSIQA